MDSDALNESLCSKSTCLVGPLIFVAEGVVSDHRFYCVYILSYVEVNIIMTFPACYSFSVLLEKGTSGMKTWSVEDVFKWLTEACQMRDEIATTFKDDDIDGTKLATMTEIEIEKIMEKNNLDSLFGYLILKKRDALIEEEAKAVELNMEEPESHDGLFSEKFRNFDTAVALTDKYRENVMLEIANEVCSTFQNQILSIAENPQTAQPWMDKLVDKYDVDKNALATRSVSGLDWQHISAIVEEISDKELTSEIKLITKSGAKIILPDSKKKELADLEILSVNECEGVLKDAEEKERLRVEKEEYFFQGRTGRMVELLVQNTSMHSFKA